MNSRDSSDELGPRTAPARRYRPTQPEGLYNPAFEHDSCGVGFVANIAGQKSHQIIQQGLRVLDNLAHRGACGCDPRTGDGAGILMQLPHEFLRRRARDEAKLTLPDPGEYGVGMVFLPMPRGPRFTKDLDECELLLEETIRQEGLRVLGWRKVPVDLSACGDVAREVVPEIRQIFVGRGHNGQSQAELERKLYIVRKRAERSVRESGMRDANQFYICSLSTDRLVYKGLLMSQQIPQFYPDLNDPTMVSGLALIHARFSTNTFPSWDLAQPFRFIAHNGEINTLRGNVNWMHARERLLASPLFGEDLKKLLPVITPGGSDSAMFDNTLELLVAGGRSVAHAMMMLIPEAWQNDPLMPDEKKAFYQYHSSLMEPWDGPASIAFSDGTVIGAVLDRNGLRPSRYVVTKGGLVVMASEVGVLDIPPDEVASKGRLQPGRMFLVDTAQKCIVSDEELKRDISTRQPYRAWLNANLKRLEDLPPVENEDAAVATTGDAGLVAGGEAVVGTGDPIPSAQPPVPLQDLQHVFGYTVEDLKMIIAPMAANGEEPVGSMGTDTPLAVLSDRPQILFQYFKQLFAQVTNPPIDPIREELVMSLRTTIGAEGNLFDETPEQARHLELDTPILSNEELERLKGADLPGVKSAVLPILFHKVASTPAEAGEELERALDELCAAASAAIEAGATILVLSDRGVDEDHLPIPSLLAVGAVHHHLIREGTRTQVGLVIESGEPREAHHFALLSGYGAGAFNPYLAYETVAEIVREGIIHEDLETALYNYRKAVGKSLLKIASKMGISTLQSYRGAQIFECIGLNREVIDKYFTWTPSRVEGVGLDSIAWDAHLRHTRAFGREDELLGTLDVGGQYQWRRRGEYHLFNPETVGKLQHAVRSGNYKLFKQYTRLVDDQSRRLATLRGLLRFKPGTPIPIDQVEPASEIVKRFKTGAMSLGSISREAHETLAIAMNRIGGKSNTGEGGEDRVRYKPDPNGDFRRSAIKQVASGRFGVTSEYLANADEIQIKMAQGAKPGEGGQLPGHKVDEYIAMIRYSTPGVGLISPPPHHDIYSIEDLAQLIHDLKNANRDARITVKLVAEMGVGTVAAGVSKAKADVVLISGHDGGTGASPLTSIKHAGVPWELGLAETQQVLVMNDLRGRIRVETDGQLKTGRDVVIACLLGAEEFGFASAALVAAGCVMMRVCHLNTCPVGVATQDPELRKRFAGQPEHVVNFMTFIAEEVREYMAELGFRTMDEMVGHVERLEPVEPEAIANWKARGVDFSMILHKPEVPESVAIRCIQPQDHGLEKALDHQLIEYARDAIEGKGPVEISMPIRNSNRTVGAMLSNEISKRYGADGLAPFSVNVHFNGSAGQSFGAFLAPGVSFTLEGDANDYFAKGLSGGQIVVFPPHQSTFRAEENIIIGNVSLYGATGGEVFIRGLAGERFAVRNSGATVVVEGCGDHGCEYMTKGLAVVLGRVGRNFAAGMSGGIAYVFDEDGSFQANLNPAMVAPERVSREEDAELLRELIRRHTQLTESEVGRRILQLWEACLPHFWKVVPMDYKKVLEAKHLDEEQMRLASV
jgi:glutamate synthase domain-containing protein 2/glutamate synthase domain-containing protein 1/glutamate synthase domain-containing protein 3